VPEKQGPLACLILPFFQGTEDLAVFGHAEAVDCEGIRLIVLANAGDAEVYGVEEEATWLASSNRR
jgi:hypothetical protein